MKKVIFLVSLYGCGVNDKPVYPTSEPPKPYNPIANMDESVREYVREFKDICDTRPSSTCLARWPKLESITIVNIETLRKNADGEKWAGVCWEWTDSKKNLVKSSIQILDNDGHGEKWNSDSLRGLLWHELGHCLLNLEHTPSPISDPKMMNPFLYPTQIYIDYWDKMVEEIFSIQSMALREESDILDDELTLTAHPFYFEPNIGGEEK